MSTCKHARAKESHRDPGGSRVTPSQPTMPPPDPIAIVLCAIPYSVPVCVLDKEGRKGRIRKGKREERMVGGGEREGGRERKGRRIRGRKKMREEGEGEREEEKEESRRERGMIIEREGGQEGGRKRESERRERGVVGIMHLRDQLMSIKFHSCITTCLFLSSTPINMHVRTSPTVSGYG